jgi:hypothetical protein
METIVMGTLMHGNFAVDFDDRILAHLQVVIINKFRRNEPVVLSWLDPLSAGDGRSSVWLTPTTPAFFKFVGSRAPRINEAWLQTLSEAAGSSTGLVVTNEDGDYARSVGIVRLS